MTQNGRILNHLQSYGSITSKEAMDLYSCFRLASRINDLKKMGYNIKSVRESGINKFGEPIHWARYSLAR